jgi:hypothetical protein
VNTGASDRLERCVRSHFNSAALCFDRWRCAALFERGGRVAADARQDAGASASGRLAEAGTRGPTALFEGVPYLSHVAGSCSPSPFALI